MRRGCLASITIASIAAAGLRAELTVAASAADLGRPTPAPVYTKASPVVADTWTGFYLGANAGGVWASDTFTAADPLATFGIVPIGIGMSGNKSGFAGGVHAGYNWQVGSSLLLGVEGDFSGADLKISAQQGLAPADSAATSANAELDVRTMASIRGRAGIIWNDWLFYGTGGWGWESTEFTADAACPITGASRHCGIGVHAPVSVTGNRSGAVFGGGTEYKWGRNWIFGVEYLRYELNGANASGATLNLATGAPISFSAACPAGTSCVNYSAGSAGVNEVRARVSYKFW
jgi:outer membrane immunogenic protein